MADNNNTQHIVWHDDVIVRSNSSAMPLAV